MNKFVSILFLALISIQFFSFVIAQEGAQVVPKEGNEWTDEDFRAFNEQRELRYLFFNILLWIVVFISLTIGFFITKYRIKKNSKISNLIIHIIMSLGSIVLFFIVLIDGARCLNDPYCGFPVFYYTLIFFSTLILPMISIPIVKNIIKNKSIPYRSNMSSSVLFTGLIFTILSPLPELIARPWSDIPAFVFLPMATAPIMLILYVILGIIGYFIDKKNNYS